MSRKLHEIAAEINQEFNLGNWSEKAAYAARPYINAMLELNSVRENRFGDSGKSVVLYFLANAASWRGENARRIKAELKAIVAAA